MKLLSRCPACNGALEVRTLLCPECGLELKNSFELSPYDSLDAEQADFLRCFLRCRGNLSRVQEELGLSYPAAQKRLTKLLINLELVQSEREENHDEEEIDVSGWITDPQSEKASEIIKAKLKEAGGRATVRTYDGSLREITASRDGRRFLCPQLIPYSYGVFDAITNLLLNSPGYRAKKGSARSAKLGEPGCEENTVAGAILVYLGKKPGESGFDPAFILAAVLEWAGIAHNRRGYLELTAEYIARVKMKNEE